MASLPLILVTEPIMADSLQWLSERAAVVETSPGEAEFNRLLPDAVAMVVRTSTIVDAAMLDAASSLQAVARAGVGLDNIDQDACRDRGIEVIHTPDANTQAVVEYVTTIVLDALRPRQPLIGGVDRDEWNAMRSADRAHRQMSECRFGVLGFGRIGSRVAEVASTLGFSIAYTDLREIPESDRHGATALPLEELLSTSDVLTIHVDGRPSNHDLIGARELARLPDHALLVNTSRGVVIETKALADRLRATPTFRAVLDVHDVEPVPDGHPLLGLPNAMLYPHVAARTTSALSNMSRVVEPLARHLGIA
jgi:phosphoglycerate dehydrogenase-like enzyme